MKKENLPIIEIAQLSEEIGYDGAFGDDIVLVDVGVGGAIQVADEEQSVPMRLNGIMFLLVTQGNSLIAIDYVDYEVKAGDFITITPDHIVQLFKQSPDMKSRMLVFSRTFMESFKINKSGPSMLRYMYVRKNPRMVMTREESDVMCEAYCAIEKKIKMKGHCFQREAVQVALLAFLLELGNIYQREQDISTPMLSRKEEIMEQFLLLLFENVKTEHRVTFYADKLFITPQYLSSTLKELSGKPANKWIDDALILEAKLLLKAPQATVQVVADQLHFSDQSTFGKFFKKHVGMSPMEYRRS